MAALWLSMFETFGMAGMLVVAFLVLAAAYVLMRLLDRPASDEGEEDGNTAPREKKPAEMSDEEFIDSYTGPMLEDALEKLEMAVESVKQGLYFYGRSAWEEAGSEFHLAARSIDEASGQLKEVIGMVENPASEPVRRAKARLEECRRMRALAIRMEEACDAMVKGKEDEARRLEATALLDLKKLADGWH